ncbi:unnamed protein product [Schistosoma margrebowiei]|uniref:Laminin G domain-containing protein n=1 Tax=Schistosoma margrebowiei TaxID=48269 RepID=A0AA84ZGZ8_9TREM|nr:unnamed protein product [Schistosoma margrebowiei]
MLFISLGQPSKIAAFSGNGFILNKLKNRPITSTEERIEIEFQTKQSNSSLFCAGSETQLLRLDLVNGLLKVFLHLPITETDIQLNLAEGNDAITQNHGIYRKNKLSSLFQLDILIQSKLDPTLRLDDNQWHCIILARSNSLLQVYIDNDLVFTRLIGPSNYQRLYLLHTQIIVLGGPYKLGDIFQMNSMDTVLDNNFIGFISKAVFQADSLEMNILEFTLSNLHGFRIQSIYPLTNKTYHHYQTNEIQSYTIEPIEFIQICHLINIMNQMITSSISFNSTIFDDNMFIILKLPTLNLLQNSIECIQQNIKSTMNLLDTLKWIHIEIQFNQYTNQQNGLLFLLNDDTTNKLKHYSLIKNNHQQIINKYYFNKNILIGAEFRNNQLYIIIQKNKQIWFNIKLNSKLNQLSLLHNQYKLQIKYTMIWLINKNNNQSLNDLWPLVKIKYDYDDTIDNWITVGPNNHYSDNNNNSNDIHLTILNNEQELKLMKNLKIVNQVYEEIWQKTLWFGRTLYLGGINYTKSIENGLFIPGIQNIHNKYQHFQGCITRVTINGLRLDLQSAFQARIRYLQSIHYEKIHTLTKFSLPIKCDNNNVTTEMFSNICSSFDSNKLSCSLNKQYHHYHHHRREKLLNSYLYNLTELKDSTPMIHFNGLQLIRIQLPVQQYSSLLWIVFMFQTNYLNETILYTIPNLQYELNMINKFISKKIDKKIFTYEEINQFILPGQQLKQQEKRMNQQFIYNETVDNFQISLVNGYIHVKYIVSNKHEVYELPLFLSDGKWHYFELIHNNSYITVYLDKNVFSQRTNVTITELPVQQIIIGSSNLYESSLLPINSKINQITGYNGNIAHFLYNGIELMSYKKKHVHNQYSLNESNLENSFEFTLNQWVIEFTAQLFEYKVGYRPTSYDFPIQFKQSKCYLSIINKHFENVPLLVKFSFKTSIDQGILLFILNKLNDNFLLIELFNGHLLFSIHFNNELITKKITALSINKGVLFNDSQWYTVELLQENKVNDILTIRINTQTSIETFTNIDLNELFNYKQSFSNYVINIGGCSMSDFMKFQGKIKSRFGFQGCIANFQLNHHPTINLLQMAKIDPSLDCNDHIVYGCESMTSGCATSQNRNNNIYPFQSSLHDFESSENSRNVYMCYNDGECLDKLNTFYCACDLTTFQGHQCNEGLQLDRKRLHHTDKLKSIDNEFITLLFAGNQFQNNLTYLHVYLEQGYLKMKFLLDGSMIVIDGPKINVQDGYYHRIRGIRSRNQILLEVDQYQTVYRLYNEFTSLLKTRYIWLGHSPLSNCSDFIQGYVTGVYYNGLRLTDLASGLQHLTFVKVTRYAEVEYTNTFQLKLGLNSPFYTKSDLRKRKKPLQLSKSTSSIFSPLSISNDFITDFNIPNINGNKCSTCTNKDDFLRNPSPLVSSSSSSSSNSNDLLPNSKIQPTIITFTKSLNIWLFICLILTGLILISSFGFLIYRCTQHRNIEEYNNHIQHYEQSTSTNEPHLLQSIENIKINELNKQDYYQNNHFTENQLQQNISFYHTGYINDHRNQLNSIIPSSFSIHNNQYVNDKIDSLSTSLYIDNVIPSNLNETYSSQNKLQYEFNNQQIDDYKLDRYVNLSTWSTIRNNNNNNNNGNFLKHSNFSTYHPHQHKSSINDFTFVQSRQAM